MSTDLNRQTVRRLFSDDLSQPDARVRERVTRELFASDFFDDTNPPGMQHGHDGHMAVVNLFMGAFPDMHWKVEDLLAEGDQVAARTTMTGTHRGEFFGIAPTGQAVSVSGIHLLTLRDGKIVRHQGVNDDLGLMRQLGAFGATGVSEPVPADASSVVHS